jgi:phage terminase small subunit
MTKGRPPVPIELKQQRGTFRADRHNRALEQTSTSTPREIPKPPDYLSQNAKRFWQSAFLAPWVNPEIDYTLILMCAEDMDMRDLICQRSKQDLSDFRLQVAARDWTRLVISYLSLLGFTPTDRARLGFKTPSSPSKLDELIARRQAR